MPHTTLISTLVAGFVLALALGSLATRLRISPLVGYLLAGVAIGPFTPGFVADQELASQLADIGVILLMFGVGLQFSPKELLSVKGIAVPGALLQIAFTTLAGVSLAWAMGWAIGTGLVFGLALSIASTVVVIRALEDRRLLDSEVGRISVGWLIVEDLVLVLAIVMLPTLADALREGSATGGGVAFSELLTSVGLTLGKAAVFVAGMLLVGQRVIPWLLHHIAYSGSRELFRLAILALALGVAFGAAELVGVSFALGAFFAGLVLSESELSQRAAEEALPLRDAFAVLFFVSVGMLFDPAIFVTEPWPVLGTLAVIVLAKPLAAFLVMHMYRYPLYTALTIAASRTQIGEFSFILAGLGLSLGLLPVAGYDLVLAGAMLSIILTPGVFMGIDWAMSYARIAGAAGASEAYASSSTRLSTTQDGQPTPLSEHIVVVGYGRVGRALCATLQERSESFLVIEESQTLAEELRERDIEVIYGHMPAQDVMEAANLAGARCLFIAIPDGFEAGQIAQQVRTAHPELPIIARAHSEAEADHLNKYGADVVVMGERELARAMLDQAFSKPVGPAGYSNEGPSRDPASELTSTK